MKQTIPRADYSKVRKSIANSQDDMDAEYILEHIIKRSNWGVNIRDSIANMLCERRADSLNSGQVVWRAVLHRKANLKTEALINQYMNYCAVNMQKHTSADMSKRTETLESAASLINGDREQDYGTPQENFQRIAMCWGMYTGISIAPHDVALMMAMLKIARLAHDPSKEDSYIDAAGYIALANELANGR